MEYHEAANLFPLDESTIGELAEDIQKNTQREPIALIEEGGEKKILDGRRRYLACQSKGISPMMTTVETDDPIAYVLSLNLHRRHLTETQRAYIGTQAVDLYTKAAKERQKRGQFGVKDQVKPVAAHVQQPKGRAVEKAAEQVGVSARSIYHMKNVVEKGSPELLEAVGKGQVSIRKAVKIANLPLDEQAAAITAGPPVTSRSKMRGNAARERLSTTLARVTGACRGLSEANVSTVKAHCTPEEIKDLVKRARESAKILRDLANRLSDKG